MSLCIEVKDVSRVKVGDFLFNLVPGSFRLDNYEFIDGDEVVLSGGDFGVCEIGFRFQDRHTQRWVYGPLTAISFVEKEEVEP